MAHPLREMHSTLDVCVPSTSVVSVSCDPMDYSSPGSSVHDVSQARILEWVSISYSRDLPTPGTEPSFLSSSTLAGRFFATEPPGKPVLDGTLEYFLMWPFSV